MTPKAQFRLRIGNDESGSWAIGPGKVALLEAIEATGSISAAARKLKMSYKRAWDLVAELNAALAKPAVVTAPGGKHGGGTQVTPVGRQIVDTYRRIEKSAARGSAADIQSLVRLLNK